MQRREPSNKNHTKLEIITISNVYRSNIQGFYFLFMDEIEKYSQINDCCEKNWDNSYNFFGRGITFVHKILKIKGCSAHDCLLLCYETKNGNSRIFILILVFELNLNWKKHFWGTHRILVILKIFDEVKKYYNIVFQEFSDIVSVLLMISIF